MPRCKLIQGYRGETAGNIIRRELVVSGSLDEQVGPRTDVQIRWKQNGNRRASRSGRIERCPSQEKSSRTVFPVRSGWTGGTFQTKQTFLEQPLEIAGKTFPGNARVPLDSGFKVAREIPRNRSVISGNLLNRSKEVPIEVVDL